MPETDKKFRFKKDTVYDAIYLSDIHYLLKKKIRTHMHKDLFKLLDHLKKRGVRFRKIFLVGDIIENWYFSAQRKLVRKFGRKRFNKLFDRFDALATPVSLKIYLIGNHDSFSYVGSLPPKIDQYLRERDYLIQDRYDSERLVVLHGHQGQYSKFSWFVNILGVRLLHLVSYIFPSIFTTMENFYRKHFNFDRNETEAEVLEYYGTLRERSNQGNRLLICGHTHQAMADQKLRVINTGDWIESGTFVVEQNQEFFGLEFKSKKKIIEKFSLKQ
ncbi:MAG: metallophosphoesterase family protein [Turneriella sp.]|nr:metallophosphoesterase family protein [Turneriella sp.]